MKLFSVGKLSLLCAYLVLFDAFGLFSQAYERKITGLSTPSPTHQSSFLEAVHKDLSKNNLPYYLERLVIQHHVPSFKLSDVVVRELTADELTEITPFKPYISSDFNISSSVGKSRGENNLYEKIIPIRLNAQTNKYEFLESYTPFWDTQTEQVSLKNSMLKKNTSANTSNTSVLATGKWYKIGVTQNGVFKMDKAFLEKLGIDVVTIDPRNIRVYGNGGKLIPEKNSVFRYDDLQENAILVDGEADGVFNDNDYVLFYGQSTDTWQHINGSRMPYEHQMHYFSDTSFYFITTDLGSGKRVSQQNSLPNSANRTTTTQDYYGVHEINQVNVVKSGREFYGEKFDFNTSYAFSFAIPNAVVGDSVYVKTGILSRSDMVSTYRVNFNTGTFDVTCSNTTSLSYYLADVGYYAESDKGGILSSEFLSVTVTKLSAQATGWLDKIQFNCRRNLIFNQSQFNFRDRKMVGGTNSFAKYVLTNTGRSIPMIWDVTNPLEVRQQNYIDDAGTIEFTSTADSLREFCIFTPSKVYAPTAYGKIPNQNLHAIPQADLVIVTHPLFMDEALRIAKLHEEYDTLTYALVTTDQVYNEFSSGTPDIGAIRDFVKMLYKRPSDRKLATRYLLLFGDGSYKSKDINTPGNTALIPTYQTPNSSSYVNSFVSDDYFAMMDDTEGDLIANDIVDVGVGRFPVKTKEEAKVVTSKMEHYYKRNFGFNPNAIESSCLTAENDYPQGDWRNWVCFVADDEDNNLHFIQANGLAGMVASRQKEYNIDKIYLDAYSQTSTPGGDRYPDATNDINRRFDKGALIVNYTGHGGELGLAGERIVEISQIMRWNNKNSLPLMVTATCEFSRFDDPERTSAGEYCLLNPNGGAIGLMTTVRVAFSDKNANLNSAFYKYALSPMANGKMPHIGDLFRLTKADIGFNPQYMNFVILGDPAIRLAYPEQKVYTSTINGHTLTISSSDTLKSLAKVTMSGYVGDNQGNKLTSFNGVVYASVFDKESTVYTLANDPESYKSSFQLQKNIIYRGKSEVINGDFTFTFLVPKDVTYNFGKGKISYYAHNGVHDANGYYDQVVVGGSNPNPVKDNQGPVVNLYMNDEKFVSGGITNESPKIYALVSDSSGVNTIGTGIGHDIVAILDENSRNPIVLNDYYVANLNTYQRGKITYPFNELAEGNHRLSLKVWDVQNNSSTAYTDFVVSNKAELALTHVLNYPNPFTSKTKFFIEHNQCCTTLKVVIQIYTISGKMIKSISQTIMNEGFRFDGIEWDGKDEFGDKLARGVYIYRVSVTDGSKKKADKIEKLVILN